MRMLCLGVGDAFSARWYSSSIALESQNAWILLDCPHPIRKILREAALASGVALDIPQLSALVLTHLHADHASGLEGYGYYNSIALNRQAILAAHPAVLDDLPMLLGAALGRSRHQGDDRPAAARLGDFFKFLPLSEEEPRQIGPFRVLCRRTVHPIPTFALRIEAQGKTLGLSSDTSFDPALIDWLAESDLVVHETNLGIHTRYEELLTLPETLRKKMRLIHYPDDFDVERSAIEPLAQGRLYNL